MVSPVLLTLDLGPQKILVYDTLLRVAMYTSPNPKRMPPRNSNGGCVCVLRGGKTYCIDHGIGILTETMSLHYIWFHSHKRKYPFLDLWWSVTKPVLVLLILFFFYVSRFSVSWMVIHFLQSLFLDMVCTRVSVNPKKKVSESTRVTLRLPENIHAGQKPL